MFRYSKGIMNRITLSIEEKLNKIFLAYSQGIHMEINDLHHEISRLNKRIKKLEEKRGNI